MSETHTPKRLYIKTYGCQMNVYDSQRMADLMQHHGYAPCDTPDDADMVVLNTCHIREKAADKVYSELGRLRQLKAQRVANNANPLLVTVAGCVAQAEGEELLRRSSGLDIVVGPQTYHLLPQMVAQAMGGKRVINTDFPTDDKFDVLPAGEGQSSITAFLSIQEGCDRFCTFCVVPYTRGAERSRPVAQIVAEAKALVARGTKEITLLGQNVNAYHGEADAGEASLAELIYALVRQVPQLRGIRYTTSHPRDMGDDLIAAHRDVPQLLPYLHLPVQAGADGVLKAMNRGHTANDYRRVIDQLRTARPDIALSSDFIVGFPGETDADFDETLRLVDDIGFAAAYSFKYSRRPGTPAAIAVKQVSEDVKAHRLQALQQVLNAQQAHFMAAQVGNTFEVLFEKAGRTANTLVARSPYLQPVIVHAPAALRGHYAQVKITAATPVSLEGVLL